MAWVLPTLRAPGYIVKSTDWNVLINNLRFLKGLDGPITLDSYITTSLGIGVAAGAGITLDAISSSGNGVIRLQSNDGKALSLNAKTGSTRATISSTNALSIECGGPTLLVIQTNGQTSITNDGTVSGDIDRGLVVNEKANPTTTLRTLVLKTTSAGHAMTGIAESDSFGLFGKAHASAGGLTVLGMSSGVVGLQMEGNATTDDTTKATTSDGVVRVASKKDNGATGVSTTAANANLMVIRNNTTTRFIFDADGDSHQDVGTAWTNFSTHDDVGLLTALSVLVSRPQDPIRGMFGEFLDEHRTELESLKLVTFNNDGHHFVNMSKLLMLSVGAIMQGSRRISALEGQLKTLLPAQSN